MSITLSCQDGRDRLSVKPRRNAEHASSFFSSRKEGGREVFTLFDKRRRRYIFFAGDLGRKESALNEKNDGLPRQAPRKGDLLWGRGRLQPITELFKGKKKRRDCV